MPQYLKWKWHRFDSSGSWSDGFQMPKLIRVHPAVEGVEGYAPAPDAAPEESPESEDFLLQSWIIRLRGPFALELFPNGCHAAAVAFSAATVFSFCGQGSGRIKKQARGLVGMEKGRFLLLVQVVGTLSATL
jgi:hypothetical protein